MFIFYILTAHGLPMQGGLRRGESLMHFPSEIALNNLPIKQLRLLQKPVKQFQA